LTLLQAVLLGVVEGVTEFLPVSSTGHLLLAQRVLGIERSEAADAYAICIQAGAILAVLGLYRERVAQALRGLAGRDVAGRRLLTNLVVAFCPAAVIGFLLNDRIDALLFGLRPVVVAWAVGGVVILALRGRTGTRSLEQIDTRTAALIGLCQVLALWPGTSRSLATILGAATGYSGLKHGGAMFEAFGVMPLAVGFVTAGVSAAVSVKWLVGWLQSHGMEVFAAWRLGLAVIVGALIVAGVLPAG
jgi:undecaprenyl-diphosphatase